MLTLADFLESITGFHPDWAYQVITFATVDSRQAIPGSLFIALPGEHGDGHDYISDAFERGASFALVEKDVTESNNVLDLRVAHSPKIDFDADHPFCIWVNNTLITLQQAARFWRRKMTLRVIGITGSVGKSTTKEVAASVLSQRFRTLKNPGNLNNEIGLPLTMLSLSKGYECAVLEMGFYIPGEIDFLCDLAKPQVGVITNVGTVHAERAGSQEVIVQGKAELVKALPPAPEGVAILNYDDPNVRQMAGLTQARVFYYGLDPRADLWADNVEGLGLEGIRFRLHYGNEILYLRVPMIGRHSVHTALRASAIGLIEGLTWQEIVGGLRSGHTQLRLMAVQSKKGALLLDDTYNASPQSMFAALNLLEELDGRKVAVLGDMLELGPYEQKGHEMVGVRAAEVADVLIVVGKLGHYYSEGASRVGFQKDAIIEFEDCKQTEEYLHEHLQKGDVVLIKGSHGIRMDRLVASLEREQ